MLKYVILMLKEKKVFKDLAYRVNFKMGNNTGSIMRCKSCRQHLSSLGEFNSL